jgi:3-methylcrotonyl-CoA carboxylase alpha subunit
VIKKLLVANRAEIACRVIRTARRLGVETVSVFSDADAHAKHVREADQAIRIGPAPARESYLDIDSIMRAVATAGADAVHPGYGFLSENAEFAEACAAADCIFVGPPAAAIRAMGSKIQAKRLVLESGTPVVPGYQGDDQTEATLAEKAQEVGYPILIKASAGGGGKGMRLVEGPDGFDAALEGAKREALASFGDDQILLERYLRAPKHIEVQILADSHGHALYLFERDCSVQRRHQKIVEEAPAPTVEASLRASMGEAATRVARSVDYVGAGTVEFITEGGEFYFMEMNTRLQVEHPVTEAILGLDLVELQLRIASGEAIPFCQNDLEINGHAVEARVYAENAKRNFLPSTGLLQRVRWPQDVRVDAGVETGSEMSVHYDPMMAKIIAHGNDRKAAIVALREALKQTEIVGVEHNVSYLRNVLAHEEFIGGSYTTELAEAAAASLVPTDDPLNLVMAALVVVVSERDPGPWTLADGFQLNLAHVRYIRLRRGRETAEVKLTQDGSTFRIDGPDGAFEVTNVAYIGDQLQVNASDRQISTTVHRSGNDVYVVKDGATEHFQLQTFDTADFQSVGSGDGKIIAPMPGTIVSVEVAVDDRVVAGQTLVVLEAMKMEHVISAPGNGTVRALTVRDGERIDEGVELVVLDPD